MLFMNINICNYKRQPYTYTTRKVMVDRIVWNHIVKNVFGSLGWIRHGMMINENIISIIKEHAPILKQRF